MAGKFARSWGLVKASAAVLSSDRKLLLFPLLSGVCTLIVAISFALPVLISLGVFSHVRGNVAGEGFSAFGYLVLFTFYLVQYAVIFFFNTALVGAAMIRLDGQSPTLGDGLRLAWSKWPQILGYAAIAATVGMLLRAVQQHAGLLGRLVMGLFGLAWTVATFLVVPILAATDTGPIDAVRRSTAMLKQTWGENIIGTMGFGVVFGVAFFVWVLIMGGLLTLATMAQSVVAMALVAVLAVLGFVLLGLIQSALQGVYAAALYRYAEYGDAGSGFARPMLEQAFRIKA